VLRALRSPEAASETEPPSFRVLRPTANPQSKTLQFTALSRRFTFLTVFQLKMKCPQTILSHTGNKRTGNLGIGAAALELSHACFARKR
jgi:hypothetical protein